MNPRVLVCCGAGGVGKTTLSAALGVRLAMDGARTAVLTVDPARRLADSLGVGVLGNQPRRVPDLAGPGTLDALVLDPKATFDALVSRLSSDPERTGLILANRYYGYVSTCLGGTWEYMSMERLLELAEVAAWDAIVLDTPPARHAMDFLTAPERVIRVLDHRVLHRLALPTTRRGFSILREQNRLATGVLGRLLGLDTIHEIASFVSAFEGLTEAFAARARLGRDLLRAPGTSFYLVTTPTPERVDEAVAFRAALDELDLPFRGYLANRCTEVPSGPDPPDPDPAPGIPAGTWAAVLEGVRASRRWCEEVAHGEAEILARLGTGSPTWRIPNLDEDVTDVRALARLAPSLPG
ncbi:MAG: ArsA family ATPase [Deltaproteobacteria bacterium]|nr:ArsA family ATPase [Deltaproteobacteria bacterium]